MELVFGAQLVVVALIVVAACCALAIATGSLADHVAIAGLGAAGIFAIMQTLPTAVLERRLQFGLLGGIEVGQRLLLTIVAIALAAAGATKLAVPVAATAAGAAAYVAVLAAARWKAKPALGGLRENTLGGYAAQWWQGRMAAQLAYAAYPVLGGVLLGAEAVGLQTLGLAITGFATLLYRPRGARDVPGDGARRDRGAPRRVRRGVFRAFIVVSVPALVFVALAAEPLVDVVLWAGVGRGGPRRPRDLPAGHRRPPADPEPPAAVPRARPAPRQARARRSPDRAVGVRRRGDGPLRGLGPTGGELRRRRPRRPAARPAAAADDRVQPRRRGRTAARRRGSAAAAGAACAHAVDGSVGVAATVVAASAVYVLAAGSLRAVLHPRRMHGRGLRRRLHVPAVIDPLSRAGLRRVDHAPRSMTR